MFYKRLESNFKVQNVPTINSVNTDRFKEQMMHNWVLCSGMTNSFQYQRIYILYLQDLGENKSVYMFSAEMSGFPAKHFQDPRFQDLAF